MGWGWVPRCAEEMCTAERGVQHEQVNWWKESFCLYLWESQSWERGEGVFRAAGGGGKR